LPNLLLVYFGSESSRPTVLIAGTLLQTSQAFSGDNPDLEFSTSMAKRAQRERNRRRRLVPAPPPPPPAGSSSIDFGESPASTPSLNLQ